jgi:hypothetical protein
MSGTMAMMSLTELQEMVKIGGLVKTSLCGEGGGRGAIVEEQDEVLYTEAVYLGHEEHLRLTAYPLIDVRFRVWRTAQVAVLG